MAFNTDGDGNCYVKYSGGTVVVGAGGADKLTVSAGNVTVANDIDDLPSRRSAVVAW